MEGSRQESMREALVRSLCEAVESAVLYGVFADDAAFDGDPELEAFYRGLQAEEQERAVRRRRALAAAISPGAVIDLEGAAVFTVDTP